MNFVNELADEDSTIYTTNPLPIGEGTSSDDEENKKPLDPNF
jgi:hypothetical protein